MIDITRARHLKEQWEKRDELAKDELLRWLLKHCWATLPAQKQ